MQSTKQSINQEKYYWEDFQHADRSSWQIIIFYFGVIGIIIIGVSDNLDEIETLYKKLFVLSILSIGLSISIFVRNHIIKYRFYSLRDREYLIEHDCEMLKGGFLFKLNHDNIGYLKNGKINDKLKKIFNAELREISKYNHLLTDKANVLELGEEHWEISDKKMRFRIIDNGKQLNIFGKTQYENRAEKIIEKNMGRLSSLSKKIYQLGSGFKLVFRLILFVYYIFIFGIVVVVVAIFLQLVNVLIPLNFVFGMIIGIIIGVIIGILITFSVKLWLVKLSC